MKDWYVGDVGDFGKYALLRFFLDKGIKLGVNWYHTLNVEGDKDGNKRDYLNNPIYERVDADFLKMMRAFQKTEDRRISYIERSGILKGAVFYGATLDTIGMNKWDKALFRKNWYAASLDVFNECELIFADPDNGLSVDIDDKSILPEEVYGYFKSGYEVMYYHHRDRSSENEWINKITYMGKYIPQARIIVLTFHPYEQRVYVFVVHEENYGRYDKFISEFLKTGWGTIPVTKSKKTSFERVKTNDEKKDSGKPCIAFYMETPEEACRHMRLRNVIRYGDTQYGKTLHVWDSGERTLCQCMDCEGFVLVQESEFHGWDDDSMYVDYFPVTGEKQADEYNRLYDGFQIERVPGIRFLQKTNGELSWSSKG